MADILKFLTDDEESRLLRAGTSRRCHDGETIVREGDRHRALYILREGEARVERSHGKFDVEVSRLRPGELFGEMGFVEDFEASASVVAHGECEVVVLDEAPVLALVKADPTFAGHFYHSIAELLSRRLRATTVDALSEFAWGSGFEALRQEATDDAPGSAWGGGSPLRDEAMAASERSSEGEEDD